MAASETPPPPSPDAQRRIFLALLAATDGLLLLAAFGLAYFFRFVRPLPGLSMDVLIAPGFYLALSLGLTPVWLALFWTYHLYDWEFVLSGYEEYAAVFHACLNGAVLVVLAQFILIEDRVVSRGWLALALALSLGLTLLGRAAVRRAVFSLRRRGRFLEPALIVGVNREARLLGEQLCAFPSSGLQVLGYLDDETPAGAPVTAGLRVLGGVAELGDYVRRRGVREVVVVSGALPRAAVLEIFRQYGASPEVQLRLSSGLFDLLNTGLHVRELGFVPLIGVNRVRLRRLDQGLKLALDYGLTLAALAGLWPVFAVIAALVRRDSPGPALHRRRVLGLNGRTFDAFKFRTMRVDGDQLLAQRPDLLAELAATHKLKDDPRVTRLGRWLRRYSLDELPQLFNVLRGEMSLVGPRMISPPELEKYGDWGLNLLTVRPGLTGLWQVSGRSDVDYAERVQLDMFYIRNYSLWLDVQIILRTLPAVFGGRGAY